MIDKNRRLHGDYQRKPTQYWFVNCKPEQNMILEPMEYLERRTISEAKRSGDASRQVIRSMIAPQYARWFIQTFILDLEE